MFDLKNKKILAAVLILLSVFMLQGCSKKLEGEVFLTNNSGKAEPLSLVEIYQLSEKNSKQLVTQINDAEKSFEENLKVTTSKINVSELESVIKATEKLEIETDKVIKKCIAVRGYAGACYDIIEAAAQIKTNAAEATHKEIARIASPLEVFENSPSSSIEFITKEAVDFVRKNNLESTRTDSSGQYVKDLLPQHTVLLAIYDPELKRKRVTWLIDSSTVGKKLTFSSQNMLGKGCKECIEIELSEATIANVRDVELLILCYKSLTKFESYPSCTIAEFAAMLKQRRGE